MKAAKPLEEVKMKLKWLHSAQFAGNYAAIEKGFCNQRGLNVTLEPYTYEDTAINSVVDGKSDFGIAGADEVLLARAEGKPVKAIAVIFKINPVVAFALKSSGIRRPQDFVGKRVGLSMGTNVEYLYLAMMSNLKIPRDKIQEIPIGYGVDELLDGKVDVSTGYIIDEPNLVVEKGQEVTTILMADYGVNIYADVLFTTDEKIRTKPEVVERMLVATLDGWQYAIEHESEAVDMTMKYAADSTRDHQASMLRSSVPLINTGKSKLGMMELSEWMRVQDILFEEKLLKNKIDINDVFTMDFLNAYYRQK